MLYETKAEIPCKYRYLVDGEWIEEDDMAETPAQNLITQYLISVIRFLLRPQKCLVIGNVFIYPKGQANKQVAPDIMVVKETDYTKQEIFKLGSWEIEPPKRPVPNVVFEISSVSTWTFDVQPEFKPSDYAGFNVPEYFAFDPVGAWVNFNTTLKGWRTVNGHAVELVPNDDGWLWSNELNCWVGTDGLELHLYSQAGQKILSPAEYSDEIAEQLAEESRARAEAEAKIEQELLARAEAEAKIEQGRLAREELLRQKVEAEQRAEQERAEAARQKAEAEANIEQERLAREELERKLAELQAKLNLNNPPQP
jgi:Putative restriction endonuclease